MSVEVSVGGRRPRLVLLHGWGLNSRVWDELLPRLGGTFTTHCIDLPGHGDSPWPPEFHDIDSLADALETQLWGRSAAQAGETLLLGWSLGAMAALALAARQPQRLCGMALVAPTPKFLRAHDWPHGVPEGALRDMQGRLAEDFHGAVRDFLLWQVHGDEHARAALKSLREKVRTGGAPHPRALEAGLHTLAGADLRPRLADVNVPTLVLSGERDRLSHPEAGAALAAALPQATFRLMAGAAHAPFLSHPEQFCDLVEQFFEAS